VARSRGAVRVAWKLQTGKQEPQPGVVSTMKKTLLTVALALALPAVPSAALAQFAFNVGAVSDYRYRGISQSRLKPAVQGGADWSHASGLYLGAWGSTIKWIEDANPASSNKVEIDLYGGYKGEITKGLGFDVGVLAYQYPGHKADVAGFPSPNTTEVYGALSFGPATLKYSHSTTNLFGFPDSKGSGYLDLSATFDLGGGLSLVPHIGRQRVAKNADFTYTDYSLALNYEAMKGLAVSATAVGTSQEKILGTPAYTSPANGKNLGKNGLVVGVKYSF
jgi:uncharacterized protein (TIGR02001 family)